MTSMNGPSPLPAQPGSINDDAEKKIVEEARKEDTATVASSDGVEDQSGPWIRYRIQYRDHQTNELMRENIKVPEKDFDAQKQGEDHFTGTHVPTFEHIAIYKTSMFEASESRKAYPNNAEVKFSPISMAPSYHITIYSVAIINALQSVVQYYPAQDLTGNAITIRAPYAILMHHYEELVEFRKRCATTDPEALCARERDCDEHLGLLLRFLDKHVKDVFHAEQERNRNGFASWENLWVSFRPGTTRIGPTNESRAFTAEVIHSVEGGIFDSPPSSWHVRMWSLNYDGVRLGRELHSLWYHKFDGEQAKNDFHIQVAEVEDAIQEFEGLMMLVKQGKIFWNLLGKQCMYHKGKTAVFPFNTVEGLVMVDLAGFYNERVSREPILMGDEDCRSWKSDCDCSLCKRNLKLDTKKISPLFGDYNNLTWFDDLELTPHKYLLCPQEIYAFVFRTRIWGKKDLINTCRK